MSSFDIYARDYDEWFEKNAEIYQKELIIMKKILPRGKCGIEIGVGTGRFASQLGIKFGIDNSINMLKISKERDVKVIQGIAEKLPIKSSIFDFVVMITTLCFLKSVNSAFREIFRILKPDGIFIVAFIDRDSNLGKIYEMKREKSKFYKNAKFYTLEEVKKMLKKTGFSNFSVYSAVLNSFVIVKSLKSNVMVT